MSDARQVADQLTDYLREKERHSETDEEMERREDEFERYLFDKGFVSHIATRDETDKEFDAFEMIEVQGESLSETISCGKLKE